MKKAISKIVAGVMLFSLVLPFIGSTPRTNAATPVFFEDFNGSALDTSKWLVAKRQWGGVNANGGVVPENVHVSNGKLILDAHGDLYTGPVKGINKDGTARSDGKRVGGAVATKDYYGSGSYEFSMKVAPKLGVCSAVWTFHYQEVEPGDPQYQGSGDYYAVNHEIDIEIPGRPGPEHVNMDFNKALFNTWRGENEGEYTTGYTNLGKYVNDGQFHTYRFDWHTGGNGQTKRVDFYLDGVFLRSVTTTIPDIAGRLWLGAWFPNGWTGTPNFDTETFEIDWVKITPFDEPGDRFLPETYPNDGWATPVTDTQAPSAPTNLTSPSKTSNSVQLSWTASTDNVGVTGYEVYKNGVLDQTVTSNSATVSGLTASTAYGFYVKAKDAAGNLSAASATLNVTTSASGGGGTNLISNGDFSTTGSWTNLSQSGAAAVISNGRMNLTPSGSGSAEVEQYVNVTPGTTYTLSANVWNSGSGTWGYLRVYDNGVLKEAGYNGTTSQTKSISFTASSNQVRIVLHAYKQQTGTFYFDDVSMTSVSGSGGGDTQAPSSPTNLTSPSKTSNSVQLSWTASTDNVGVTGYEIYKNGVLDQTVTSNSATVSGLTASTAYSFYVKAKDAAGNLSAASATLNVTTSASGGDGTNLISNGDFSTTGSWTNLSQSGAAAVISNGRMNLTPSGSGSAEVEQYVNVTPGTTYTLSANVWNSGSGTWGYLRVYDNGVLKEAGYNGTTSQTKSISFTASSNQVRVVLHAYKQQTGTFYFDDVTLN